MKQFQAFCKATSSEKQVASRAILEIPPFPGARFPQFATPLESGTKYECSTLLEALATHRVGGCYWGQRPDLRTYGFVLDGTAEPLPDALVWPDDVDPWHLLLNAGSVRLAQGDTRGLLALAASRPLTIVEADGSEREGDKDLASLVVAGLTGWRWQSPFDGGDITPLQAIELCGFWRQLIDDNRGIGAVMGIADWKKTTVSPLLWSGKPVAYCARLGQGQEKMLVAAWLSRLTDVQKRDLEAHHAEVVEIEDGFIRSTGLGANCVPPLSIVVDPKGIHFNPCSVSTLENLLEHGVFSPLLLERAAQLRHAITCVGLTKYGRGTDSLRRPEGDRLHVLVPGQVEDDRSVTSGLAVPSNLELLRRVRANVGSEAFVIYKPHPDVLAGHRRGDVQQEDLARLADHIENEASISTMIDMVDELHVNTSLAGFEALLRGKRVNVYGVPFYAGWGLTIDHASVPLRRRAKRSLDELVAASLILYPRYLDPTTGLPSPVEVLIDRLSSGQQRLGRRAMLIVAFRKALGRINRALGSR